MALPSRKKRPDEKRTLTFEFVRKLATGDSISSVQVPAVSGITLTAGTVSGTKLLTRVGGGTLGQTYKVVGKAFTANGDELHLSCNVTIEDDVN